MKTVRLMPADASGCGYYRMIYPASACRDAGYPVVVDIDAKHEVVAKRNTQTNEFKIVSGPELPEDVIVFQRPSTNRALAMVEYMKAQGHEIVVELDDNFYALSARNQAWHAYQTADQNVVWLRRCCELADRIVVSTPELGAVYQASAVVENCVPELYLTIGRSPREDREMKVLGWSGTLAVHKDDLDVVGGGVDQALRTTRWPFYVIGEPNGVGEELGIGKVGGTGWMPMDKYPHAVAGLDLAIAPIADTAFNRSKSWIKPLEYAALGVPCVVSPSDEYRRLGVGRIAAKPRHWKAALTALMTSHQAYDEAVAEGLEIAEKWTYQANASRWYDAWAG